MANRIGEYEQLTPMRTAGSGSARWCVAGREDHRFFLKEFLSPVYPAPGKTSIMAEKQKKRCERFESQKRRMYAALSCVIGDTLVPVIDFFRHDRRYYAASEEVPHPHLDGETVASLTARETRELLYSLTQCLQRLHTQGIVHADLKPEHLLLLGGPGQYELRLIDLDSGFLEEDPPAEQRDIEGDPVYLAPETFLRLTGEDVPLTCKLDTFALGILIHRLWTGVLPAVDTEKYSYVYEAALDGGDIRLAEELPPAYRLPVLRMLRKDPEERPDDAEIVRLLFAPKEEAPPSDEAEEKGVALNGMSRLLKKRERLLDIDD